MTFHDREAPKTTLETEGRSQLIRHEVMEMHLFDENAPEEQSLCGGGTTRTERISVREEYLDDLLYGNRPRAVCQDCKALSMPLAEVFIKDMARNREDEGRLGEAEDYRELLKRLARETGLDRGTG